MKNKLPYEDCLISSQENSCYICGKSTRYIDLNAETFLCSKRCASRFYRNFIKALNKKRKIKNDNI